MKGDYEVMGIYSHSTKYEYKDNEEGARYRNATYWFVRKRNDEIYEVRPLDSDHLPTGLIKLVTREDFLQFYTPELSYYKNNTLPCLESLQQKVRMGRRLFNVDQLNAEEKEFVDAVLFKDAEGEDGSGLADVYAEQRQFTNLRAVIDKLLSDDEFLEEERHRFNDFGINLRKEARFDDSIRFYSKALEVNAEDENLHFNIARVYHDKGELEQCRTHLEQALGINPDMPEARSFLRMLDGEKGAAKKPGKKAKRNGATDNSGPAISFDL